MALALALVLVLVLPATLQRPASKLLQGNPWPWPILGLGLLGLLLQQEV